MIMCVHVFVLNAYTCYYLVDSDAYTAFTSAGWLDEDDEDYEPGRPVMSRWDFFSECMKIVIADPTGYGALLNAG